MHRLILWHSFAELVAQILLFGLAFFFLNKKKADVHGKAENSDTRASGSLTVPAGTNSGVSSSTLIETTSGASSSSTESSGNCYDVFLNFRGEDTRKNFTDHLYHGLIGAGITTFRDSNELRRGREFSPDLYAAIENSTILIPILSVNYGSSRWCLDELVRIMEFKNEKGHVVLPIFYNVEPSDVRYQRESFGKAFHDYKSRRNFDPTILEKWKQALNEVSFLNGWDAKRPEGELVQLVVQEVRSELINKFKLDTPENVIGIDSQVKKIMKFIANNSRDPLFVGIHGMGGIGKTTIAKTIYNKLLNKFEHHSFIADIRGKYVHGVEHLQKQLVHDILKKEILVHNKDEGVMLLSSNFKKKKVLILLDDVGADNHLKYLARSPDWFSPGSVIIVTTRDEGILDRAPWYYKHDHKELKMDSSLILFSRHAFRKDAPPSEFKKLTNEVVSTTGGLPLSLEVLGSFLGIEKRGVWEDTIEELKNVPHEQVQDTLKISYNALDEKEQEIFLDIACFFIGTDWTIASYMWAACGFHPYRRIPKLRSRSLIKYGEDNELIMHDQLRDLGRGIVCKNEKEPQNRSRLWDSKKVLKMLEEDEVTEKIEAIDLSKDNLEGFILMGKQFQNLKNLRFLAATGAHFRGDFEKSTKKLKWLQWQKCPSDFEANNFHVEELEVLDLSKSNISDKWQGWRFIMMAKNLKYLNLEACDSLKNTSFLSAFENLEVLNLRFCSGLEQIDSSIGNLKSLVRLDLMCSHKFKELPVEVGKLEALEQLYLIFCQGFSSLPESIGALQKLEILQISSDRLKGLPAEVGKLKALKRLDLTACNHLSSLPDSIWALQNLEILKIGGIKIKELSDGIGDLQNLAILDISGTMIKELPNGIRRLRKLRNLQAIDCDRLGGDITESIRNLSSLECLDLCRSFRLQPPSVLPSSLKSLTNSCQIRGWLTLSNWTQLKELDLACCRFLEGIGEHPSKILGKSLNTPFEFEIFRIAGSYPMETMDFSQFNHLRDLSVWNCNALEIRGLDKLKYLERLNIQRCCVLQDIPGLEESTSLEEIYISDCSSIKILPDLSSCTNLTNLAVHCCEKLTELRGLEKLEKLMALDISYCKSLKTKPKLSGK